jgi:hypothetical protein
MLVDKDYIPVVGDVLYYFMINEKHIFIGVVRTVELLSHGSYYLDIEEGESLLPVMSSNELLFNNKRTIVEKLFTIW